VEGTETRGYKVFRKRSCLVIAVGERKSLQNRKGVVKCAVQLQTSETPTSDGDSTHTIAVLEREKGIMFGMRGHQVMKVETEDEGHRR
jgi:hypothetical protein